MLKYLALHSAHYFDIDITTTNVNANTSISSSTDVAARVVPTISGDIAKDDTNRNHNSSGGNNHHSDSGKPIVGLSDSDSIDGSVTDIGMVGGSSSTTAGDGGSVNIGGHVPAPHANSSVARLLSHFEFRCHHCLVFPLHGMNLFEYLKKKEFVGLPVGVVKKIATQLLHCLVHLKVSDKIVVSGCYDMNCSGSGNGGGSIGDPTWY